ncbi:MAG: HupE/UreJ family protein [Gammaproteobacteria bacterium]
MKHLRIVAGLLCLAATVTTTYAHDYRPLLVRVSEASSGRYVVTWQPSPVLSAADQPTVELAGAGCKEDARERSLPDQRRSAYRCDDPSTPLRIEITYPNDNPSLPTLLNLTRADGSITRVTGSPGSRSITLAEPQPESLRAQSYALIGFDHILRGVDHLIFLSFLWLITGTGWVLIRALTGFTVGHSVTLALAATGISTPPASFIESMIALSIILMAAESLKDQRTTLTLRHPVMVSTLFGLLHGYGFAGYLREVGLPKNDELSALLMFNIGVEAGQIAFVLAIVAVGVMIRKASSSLVSGNNTWTTALSKEKNRTLAAYAGGALAAFWFVERTWEGLSPLTTVG